MSETRTRDDLPSHTLARRALDELLRRITCNRATGTAILVLTTNQGGVTGASIGTQDQYRPQ